MKARTVRNVRIVLRGAIRVPEFDDGEKELDQLKEHLLNEALKKESATHPEWWFIQEARYTE